MPQTKRQESPHPTSPGRRLRRLPAIGAGLLAVLALAVACARRQLASPVKTNPPARTPQPGPRLSAAGNAALRAGIAALQQGRPDEAARVFAEAVAADPRSPLTHDYLGVALLQAKRYDDALREFQTERSLAPDSATPWARIADVYHARQDVGGAIAALEKGVAIQPELAQLHLNLGILYPLALDLNKALAALDRCVALEPRNANAQYLRGNLLFKLARLDEAEAALQEAIRLSPQNGLYQYALAQVILRRRVSPETTARARAALEQALALGVSEPAAAHYDLGRCFQREKNLAAARKELETATAMAPEAWRAFYALQDVLQQLGRTEDAKRARARFVALRTKEDLRMQRSFFQQETERNPDSADAHYQLAAFLARHGEPAAAQRAVARARALAAVREETPGLRKRIDALAAQLPVGAAPP